MSPLTEDNYDDVMDRLSDRHKIAVMRALGNETEPTESDQIGFKLAPHFGARLFFSYIWGAVFLTLAIAIGVASAGMLLPLSFVCLGLAGQPLAMLIKDSIR